MYGPTSGQLISVAVTLTATEPMPLDIAVKLCFPHGGATKRTPLLEIGATAVLAEIEC